MSNIINNFVCPVCGKHTFKTNNDDTQCPVCFWWNDIVQNCDPDYDGGENSLSLNQYRKEWQKNTQ